MPETTPGSPMAKWWVIIAIVAVVLIAIAYFATRHSQHADINAAANGTGQGGAYDATTGNVVPANGGPPDGRAERAGGGRQQHGQHGRLTTARLPHRPA